MSYDLKNTIIQLFKDIIQENSLTNRDVLIEIENSKERQFGDWSVNAAMKLVKDCKKPPMAIAQFLVEKIEEKLKQKKLDTKIEKIEIKAPGFINIFISSKAMYDVLSMIQDQGDHFGRIALKNKQKILIEFVSANPTGPLSIAHARQAAVGESLASILTFCGQTVSKEYYINDDGNQIRNLGLSLLFRYQEKLGKKDIDLPEQGYKGDYLIELAQQMIDLEGAKFLNDNSEPTIKKFSDFAAQSILKGIEQELKGFGVEFDQWFSQKDHVTNDKVNQVLNYLKTKNLTYELDGATWFKSTEFGDDKDRVVIKSDGLFTYLAPDIAYHKMKFDRGFDKLIDILGPDHHGYINRIKAAACALGHNKNDLEVLIIQLATLSRAGQPVKMSTRAGEYITLQELIEEVGCDAARFFFLMRRCDSQLDFDLELAKKHSMDNPVYYVQYAHARICSIFEAANNYKTKLENTPINFDLISEPEAFDLIRKMNAFSDVLEICANSLDPQPLTTYLRELAADFHAFYSKCRVFDESQWELTKARLVLIECVKRVIAIGLNLLGVSAPEKM
ncbi:MAG: arginine--tRNA ligase [Candidatus Omnitrophica bacterium]|nr:arginine--tRNA ligase [Candidatus Omnitrophota bacterium]